MTIVLRKHKILFETKESLKKTFKMAKQRKGCLSHTRVVLHKHKVLCETNKNLKKTLKVQKKKQRGYLPNTILLL